jgi:putative transposase
MDQMEQQAIHMVHQTYKEKLRPTPAQERALEDVLWRCRDLYNTALEQRITAWQPRRISISRYEQEAELKDIRAAFSEYGAIHSHILQDALARLDKTYQAFFRRSRRREKAGLPRFKGRTRFHSFTLKEYSNGARLDNGFLVLSKIGRIGVHWSRSLKPSTGAVRLRGPLRPSPSRRRRMGGMSPSRAPMCRHMSCRPPDRRRG